MSFSLCGPNTSRQRPSIRCADENLAIWDNRSAFHTATFDYEGLGDRFGHRAVGIGEAPFLDPESKSRTQVLDEERAAAAATEKHAAEKGAVEKPTVEVAKEQTVTA